MLEPFCKVLSWARGQGVYRRIEDFARHLSIAENSYRKYESGAMLPTKSKLQELIDVGGFPPQVAKLLRDSWLDAKAKKVGLEISPVASFDPEKEAENLSVGVEIVLRKEVGTSFSPRTRKALKELIQKHLQQLKEYRRG
jgi:transcriptional regulator with XRE-family HTH domain